MPPLARLAAPLSALILASFAIAAEPAPPAPPASAAATMFDHELRRLHSDEVVRLAPRYAGHPVLVVNTASHCGYTGQFKGLEALHQRYKNEGLKVAGFSSDDFKQEADDEAKAAEVCFLNYGVTFDMYAPIHVRGPQAHPLFQELARQSAEPRWNFHKYVIGRDGRVVAAFPSRVEPDAPELREAIEKAL